MVGHLNFRDRFSKFLSLPSGMINAVLSTPAVSARILELEASNAAGSLPQKAPRPRSGYHGADFRQLPWDHLCGRLEVKNGQPSAAIKEMWSGFEGLRGNPKPCLQKTHNLWRENQGSWEAVNARARTRGIRVVGVGCGEGTGAARDGESERITQCANGVTL